MKPLELSIVMPCLNEAETLGTCIVKAMRFLTENNIDGEIIVGDNGSTDGSQEVAIAHGAKVVSIQERGYGIAIQGAVASAQGTYIIMGDADDSYDFENLSLFVEKLREGYDLVMGNRFKGGIKDGAMPFLHRYLGNPVLSGIGQLFFKSSIKDFHCGLRGFKQTLIEECSIQSNGMEFASEMIVKATLLKKHIVEVPVVLSPDGRSRPPHLRTWHDGWRHLRFLLLYSPRWLFLIPGTILMISGTIIGSLILIRPLHILNVYFDTNTLLYAATAVIVGFQAVTFSLLARTYATQTGFLPQSTTMARLYRYINLESGLIAGILITLAGAMGSFYSLSVWRANDFGELAQASMLRIVIPSITCIILGLQIMFSSFFLSMLGLKKNI